MYYCNLPSKFDVSNFIVLQETLKRFIFANSQEYGCSTNIYDDCFLIGTISLCFSLFCLFGPICWCWVLGWELWRKVVFLGRWYFWEGNLFGKMDFFACFFLRIPFSYILFYIPFYTDTEIHTI